MLGDFRGAVQQQELKRIKLWMEPVSLEHTYYICKMQIYVRVITGIVAVLLLVPG